jgi:hypothetical protein
MVKSKRDEEMRKVVLSALAFRRIANASPEMREVIHRMEEALRMLAAESKLKCGAPQKIWRLRRTYPKRIGHDRTLEEGARAR